MAVNTAQICIALDAAGIPYTGVEPADGTVHYAPSATAAQITQGNSIAQSWVNPSATTVEQAQRGPALALLQDVMLSGLACLERARDKAIVDEFNNLITWINNYTAAVAAATSLADLQSRVKALAVPATLTKASVLTAIQNAINAGSGDTTTS